MFKTKIVEARPREGQIEEVELGWVNLPEVPIEKRPPQPAEAGKPQPAPMVIKIGGEAFWIIGHTWDLLLTPSTQDGPKVDSEATLVLVVQKVPPMPSGLVRADAGAMDQLERLMPPPGGRGN